MRKQKNRKKFGPTCVGIFADSPKHLDARAVYHCAIQMVGAYTMAFRTSTKSKRTRMLRKQMMATADAFAQEFGDIYGAYRSIYPDRLPFLQAN